MNLMNRKKKIFYALVFGISTSVFAYSTFQTNPDHNDRHDHSSNDYHGLVRLYLCAQKNQNLCQYFNMTNKEAIDRINEYCDSRDNEVRLRPNWENGRLVGMSCDFNQRPIPTPIPTPTSGYPQPFPTPTYPPY